MTRGVRIRTGAVELEGDLTLPPEPAGIIVFAHGSGSGRKSPRNQQVAGSLVASGFATLLFDLLTAGEEAIDHYTAQHRFDIPLLADRLAGVLRWVREQPRVGRLPIGVFGASTGAAAALIASTRVPDVAAVVSRGGRPDLAAAALPEVTCPTLLIVGGHDPQVIELNRRALQQMTASARISIVPGATHLFEEPGTLDEVVRLATSWFHTHLIARRPEAAPIA
jgi:putative phosphoribosyl transferase